jgi:folylpolyglutamate synthase/dihydropteroate synthase
VAASGLVAADRLDDAVARGVATARWPGRYETVSTSPLVILDGAHDGLAATVLAATLRDDDRLRDVPLHLVVGCSTGHAPAEILVPLLALPRVHLVATAAHHPRAIDPALLAAASSGTDAVVVGDVAAAVDLAVGRAHTDGGAVVVTGSLFVVGEARARFLTMPADPARPRY